MREASGKTLIIDGYYHPHERFFFFLPDALISRLNA
jgi:hypothetical protein